MKTIRIHRTSFFFFWIKNYFTIILKINLFSCFCIYFLNLICSCFLNTYNDLSISFDLKNIGFFSSWKLRFQVMDSVCFFKKISHDNIYIYYFIYKPIFSQRKVDFPLQNGEITFTSIYVSFLKMLQYFKACKSLETWLNDIF